MPTESASPVPLILLFTTIGFIVGAVVAYLAAKKQPSKAPTSKEFNLFNERKKRFNEIVGLWRDRATGKFVVWYEEKMLDSSKPLDPIRRRWLESAEHDFQAWLGMEESSFPVEAGRNTAMESRLASVTRPPTGPLGVTGKTPTGPLNIPKKTPTGPLAPPTRTPTGPLAPTTRTPTGPLAPATKTPTGPLGVHEPVRAVEPSPAVMPEESAKAVKVNKPLSIVEQINDILQETIKDTPLAARMIRLVEDPREGVVVWVGLEHFPGVDSVPDPEIKAALRRAANEWERRTELHR